MIKVTNLEKVSFYYSKASKAGHTELMMKAVRDLSPDSDGVIVVCANKEHVQVLREQCPNKNVEFVTITDLDNKLLGRNQPMLIDHFTLQIMVEEMREEILRREVKLVQIRKALGDEN